MDNKHPNVCEYCKTDLEMTEWEGGYFCANCGKAVAVVCPLCGGEGYMEEGEMEGDWVNYGDDLVTCRECSGYGWTASPSFS